jgi:hypothetical protein
MSELRAKQNWLGNGQKITYPRILFIPSEKKLEAA